MSKYNYVQFYIIIFLFLNIDTNTSATHIIGNFRTDEFFKFLVKFGFQKTDRHSQRDSFGYIYGNITSQDSFPVPLTVAVLDRFSFLEYYGNRTVTDKDRACQQMFAKLNTMAYDKQCNPKAKGDYLRKVPCPHGKLCVDEDSPGNVVPNNQFTYVISDLNEPRFWYVSLVACYRNTTTCQWHHYDYKKMNRLINNITKQQQQQHIHVPEINYDFYLVNGNPNHTSYNPLTFHYSYEKQNTFEMYLVFFLIYVVLLPLQCYAVRIQKHHVTKLFTISLLLEFISLCFILAHMIRYAMTGMGNEHFKTTGDIFDIFSRTSFMLILLLLAKGWAVTRQQISRTGWMILMTIWIPYCAFNVVLYVWNRTEVDIISDVDEYQTWPGWLVLACRSAIMLWFLWELRNTMKYEHSTKKLDFLLHFGASSLVWFIYLPVAAIVALQVSPLWRYKLLLGITNSVDCLAYCVMTGLLWPNRAGQYLLLVGINYAGMDELDEFNEAPHIVHGDTFIPTDNPLEDTINDSTNNLILTKQLNDDTTNLFRNGDINTDLLNDEDDIVIMSTDELLINNSNNLLNNGYHFNNNINHSIVHSNNNNIINNQQQQHQHFINEQQLLEINGESIDLNRNSRIIA